jgi:NitT/TauT family transport system substrate-binding protein
MNCLKKKRNKNREVIIMKKRMISVWQATFCMALLLGNAAVAGEAGRVGSLKGPTSMGLLSFMEKEKEAEEPNFTFEMMTAADELSAKFIKGEIDFALIPANMASILYHKTEGNVQVADINTLGVLYLVTGREDIRSVADLQGNTVYMTGKGQTPEYVLRYLLEANGLAEEDVTVEFKSEATEVVSVLAQEPSAIAVLPQPFATVACAKSGNKNMVLSDLTKEWDAVGTGTLVTGVTVVKKDFAQANPELVEQFLEAHEASAAFVNENPAETARLTVSYGIMEQAEAAEMAIPKCNITYLDGKDMQEALTGYLQVLMEQNPDSIGGTIPGEDFYYNENGKENKN